MSEQPPHPEATHEAKAYQPHSRRGGEILGMPLYSIDEGKHLGEIDGLFVNRADFSVPLLQIRKTGTAKPWFVPFTSMETIGENIALVGAESVLLQSTPQGMEGLETDLPGRPVFTQSGESVGHIAGFGLDTQTGQISFLRVQAASGFFGKLAAMIRDTTIEVPLAFFASLGPDAVIVQDAVKSLLHPQSSDGA